MQQKVKSNSVITSKKLSDNVIEFTVLGVGSFTFDKSLVAGENRARAEDHGWNQRISDRAAIGRADAEGNQIRADVHARMKFDAMKACAEHYQSGNDSWSMVASTEPLPTNLTIRAAARAYSISVDRALEIVQAQAKRFGVTTQKILAEYRDTPGVIRDTYLDMKDAERVTDAAGDMLLAEFADLASAE